MEKRKNIALRAATVLCVLVLFCAAFVGGTFARYTTNDDANDTARVAKWGISLSVGGSLFGADYNKNGAAINPDSIVVSSEADINVQAATTDRVNIAAPGTQADQGIVVNITGTPEVQYIVNAMIETVGDPAAAITEDIFLGAGTWGTMVPAQAVTAENFADNTYYVVDAGTYTVATIDNLTDGDDLYELNDVVELDKAYYPIIWTIKEEGASTGNTSTSARNLVEVAEVLRGKIDALAGDANDAIEAKYTLTWAWAFTGNTTDIDAADVDDTDEADTILGNLIAGAADAVAVRNNGTNYVAIADGTNCNLTVEFDIAVEVLQVD